MQSARGFTLIELLVVISIISIMSVVAFVNFKDFAQDQILNKAIGQIQTYLRLAQANATAGVLCQGIGGVDWAVVFQANQRNLDLICGVSGMVVKTLTLENVLIDSVKSSTCAAICTNASCLPLKVSYSKLDGSVKITSSADQTTCLSTSSQILINVKNLKTNNIKTFTISKGGATDAQ